jgi:hypothetical protein
MEGDLPGLIIKRLLDVTIRKRIGMTLPDHWPGHSTIAEKVDFSPVISATKRPGIMWKILKTI